MILLLIIADDFTGALDTGVQFAAHGVSTRVIVDPEVDFSAYHDSVLVIDTETRTSRPGKPSISLPGSPEKPGRQESAIFTKRQIPLSEET